jgi:hypothetical protein
MRGRCIFKKTDIKRAIKAMREAGIEPDRVEVDKQGKIIVSAISRGCNGDSASIIETSSNLTKLI